MLLNSALFRRIELQLLMNLTARAIGQPPRRLWTMPNDKALETYAEYTRHHLSKGVDQQMLQRMNEEAYKMGRLLRRLFRLHRPADAERFIVTLYRHIGITLQGHIPGQICIPRCYFSQHYTPAICRAASALDDGIIRGIAGGGQLTFQQRITENKPCCKAYQQEVTCPTSQSAIL